MSGRIRSIKPEWLEDERMALVSDAARVLSIALLLLADDYGNGRAAPVQLAGRVFPGRPLETLEKALEELAGWFAVLYELDGQHYFSIRNWEKHQKVDKPGKPRVPAPPDSPANLPESVEKVPASRGSRSYVPGPGTDPDPDARETAGPPSPDRFAASFAEAHPDDAWAFEQWRTAFGKTGATFDDRRARVLAERRLAGMIRQDVTDALAGAKFDTFVTGQKDGTPHDGVAFIFADSERYEGFRDAGRRARVEGVRPIVRTGRNGPVQPSHGLTGAENAEVVQ